MKPTLRKNGIHMFEMSIKFSVGIDQVYAVICAKVINMDEPLPDNRKMVLEWLREGLHENGWAASYVNDEIEADETVDQDVLKQKRADCREIAYRFFPEMKGELERNDRPLEEDPLPY